MKRAIITTSHLNCLRLQVIYRDIRMPLEIRMGVYGLFWGLLVFCLPSSTVRHLDFLMRCFILLLQLRVHVHVQCVFGRFSSLCRILSAQTHPSVGEASTALYSSQFFSCHFVLLLLRHISAGNLPLLTAGIYIRLTALVTGFPDKLRLP